MAFFFDFKVFTMDKASAGICYGDFVFFLCVFSTFLELLTLIPGLLRSTPKGFMSKSLTQSSTQKAEK